MKHPILLSVVAPSAVWSIWLAAVHEWLIKWTPDLQAVSFILAICVSLCALIGWAIKGVRWLFGKDEFPEID